MRRILALAAVLAAAGALAAVQALPASAVTPVHIYEASSPQHWRIGSPDLNFQTHAAESMPGRFIDVLRIGSSNELAFHTDNSKCVGLNIGNTFNVDVKSCGADGTLWTVFILADGSAKYRNNYAFNHNFFSQYLSGLGCTNGCVFFIDALGAPGDYQRFFDTQF